MQNIIFKQKDRFRFETHFWVTNKNDCWNWKSCLDKDGYGKFSAQGKYYQAHRVAYYFENGNFDPQILVLHDCDNPSCVNHHHHLFLGTSKDNTDDMVRKQRYIYRILDPQEKEEVFQLYQSQQYRQIDLADKYKTSRAAISRIIVGRRKIS